MKNYIEYCLPQRRDYEQLGICEAILKQITKARLFILYIHTAHWDDSYTPRA